MRSLLNPLTATRLALTGVIGAARLGTAGIRGATALAGTIASEVIGLVRPPSEHDHRARPPGPPPRGPAERAPWDDALDAPPAPRPKRQQPRRRRPTGHVEVVESRPERAEAAPETVKAPRPERAEAAPETVKAPRPRAPKPPRARPAAPKTENGAPPQPAAPPLSREGHVSEEPRLAGEFADPGAEDGAGAHVQIDEPWNGYASMKAGEVVDRLVAESEAVLSVVILYERAHRARRSVLEAAERQLAQRASGPASSRG